jgi:hypothetical protein
MISLQVKIHAPRRTSKSSLCMLRLSGVESRMSATRSQQGIFSISPTFVASPAFVYEQDVSDFEFGIWLKLSRHLLHGAELPNYSVNS